MEANEGGGFSLFGGSKRGQKRPRSPVAATGAPAAQRPRKAVEEDSSDEEAGWPAARVPATVAPAPASSAVRRAEDIAQVEDFGALGLDGWLVKACLAMGLRRPTPIQCGVIPSIAAGRDVIGCAQTGSGKTAAFALPILNHLAADPYGVHTVVLTPSRELAIQIAEQFQAFGAPVGVRVCTVIGGGDLTAQSLELSRRPHIIVATPGRLAHHLTLGAVPPNLLKHLAFLVLDEADRLLDPTFGPDLATILSAANPGRGTQLEAGVGKPLKPRQTLLFSATIPVEVDEGSAAPAAATAAEDSEAPPAPPRAVINMIGLKDPLRCDVSPGDVTASITVASLKQQYLFVPSTVKNAYLFCALLKLLSESVLGPAAAMLPSGLSAHKHGRKDKKSSKKTTAALDEDDEEGGADDSAPGACRSAIVFVSTVAACQQVAEMLVELGLPCTALHSGMPQRKRIGSLARFKSLLVPVLVATDVASRGLDIPTVDCVINYDVPQVPSDYIHRVGRTARAGRGGRALTLVSEADVELVHAIEERVLRGSKMAAYTGVDEETVLLKLNKVTRAWHMGKARLSENGFEDVVASHAERKKEGRDKAVAGGFLAAPAPRAASSGGSGKPRPKAK